MIADSIIVTCDGYDQRIYAVGKGPSATTVTSSTTGVNLGSSITIQGIVTDISPGTKNSALSMRFPNGVPAISDSNMSSWMLHVYKQFPIPENVQGVPNKPRYSRF